MVKQQPKRKRVRKATSEEILAAQEAINEFLNVYSPTELANISFDVFCICITDEQFGLSGNRKKIIIDYLKGIDKVINAMRLFAQPVFLEQQYEVSKQFDTKKVQEARKALDRLSHPFWTDESGVNAIEQRLAYEKFLDTVALDGVDKDDLLPTDIGLRFFVRYGLNESLELLDNLFACFAPFDGLGEMRQRAIADFYTSLKDLLLVTYLQFAKRWKEDHEIEKGGRLVGQNTANLHKNVIKSPV